MLMQVAHSHIKRGGVCAKLRLEWCGTYRGRLIVYCLTICDDTCWWQARDGMDMEESSPRNGNLLLLPSLAWYMLLRNEGSTEMQHVACSVLPTLTVVPGQSCSVHMELYFVVQQSCFRKE
eukprot:1143032-Pelagomonas_calceolata.AAC.5